MPEPTDAIVPILQRIQAELGEVKRDLGDKIDGPSGKVDSLTERMDDFEDYFTFTMGLTQQNKADAIKARLDGPEGQR